MVFSLDYPEDPSTGEQLDLQHVGVWDIAKRSMRFELRTELGRHPITELHGDDGPLLVRTDITAAAWSLDGTLLARSAVHGAPLAIAASDQHLAIIGDGPRAGRVLLLKHDGSEVRSSAACGPPRVLAFSPNGDLLAVAGEKRSCVLSVPTLRPVFSRSIPKLKRDRDMIVGAEFVSDERVVDFPSGDGTHHLYALKGGATLTSRGQLDELGAGRWVVTDRDAAVLRIMDGMKELSRRELSADEMRDSRLIPELRQSRSTEPTAADRLRARLCMVHGRAFPPALCARPAPEP